MSAQPHRTVGILAFPDMEVLDYAGPYEVFNVVGELVGGFSVESLALTDGPVAARGGFTVVPDRVLPGGPVPDVVVIPGGGGSRALVDQDMLLDWLRSAAAEAEVVASVCTGSLVLAAAGLLADRPATTHHDAFGELAAISPSTQVVTDRRFVHAGENIWTSGGISAGIDLALHLVERLGGDEARAVVATEMEWGWHPDS